MRAGFAFVAVPLVAALTACGEGVGPSASGSLAGGNESPQQTAASDRDAVNSGSLDDQITSIWGDTVAYSGLTVIRQAPDAPPLETYDTSFAVIVGRPTSFRIHYENVDGWTRPPVFIEITVPRDAQLVDHHGAVHQRGDSVEVHVTIDPERFEFAFQPHGSTFMGRKPVTLWVSLLYADFGNLRPELLRVWYQPTELDEWTTADTEIDPGFRSLTMKLRHFSGYAIAW